MLDQVSGGSWAGERRILLRAFLFLRMQSVKQHVQYCEIPAELLRGTVEHGREPPGWQNRLISGLCSGFQHSQKNLSVYRCRLRGWLQLPTFFTTCPFSLTLVFSSSSQINESSSIVSSTGLFCHHFPNSHFQTLCRSELDLEKAAFLLVCLFAIAQYRLS